MDRGYKLKDRPEYNSKPRPITFKKNDSVAKAVKIMSEKNYGSVVVVDNQSKVIGICTERDILIKLVNKKLSAEKTKIAEIMTENPRVGKEDDEVLSWLRTMSNDRFSGNSTPQQVHKMGAVDAVTVLQSLAMLKATDRNNHEIKENTVSKNDKKSLDKKI